MQFDARYVVITSDEHYTPSMRQGPWAKHPMVRGTYELAAMEVARWCRDHESEGIVRISGADTLDTADPQPDRLRWLQDYFESHLKSCQAYLYIQGQHERSSKCPDVPWMTVISDDPKVQYMDNKRAMVGDELFYFSSNVSVEELFDRINSLVDEHTPPNTFFNLIAHQLWSPWVIANSLTPNLQSLPPHIRRVFSGDMHMVKNDVFSTTYGATVEAYSIGPFCAQAWGEETAPRFIVFDTQRKAIVSVPLPSREMTTVKIHTEEELERLCDLIKSKDTYLSMTDPTLPLLRVQYSSRIPNVMSKLEQVSDRKCYIFFHPFTPVDHGAELHQIYTRDSIQASADGFFNLNPLTLPGTPVRSIIDTVMDARSQKDLETRLNQTKDKLLKEMNTL